MFEDVKFKGRSGFLGRVIFCLLTLTTLAIFIRMRKMRYQYLSQGLFYSTQKTFQVSNKNFCSIVDQTHDPFWGYPVVKFIHRTLIQLKSTFGLRAMFSASPLKYAGTWQIQQ